MKKKSLKKINFKKTIISKTIKGGTRTHGPLTNEGSGINTFCDGVECY